MREGGREGEREGVRERGGERGREGGREGDREGGRADPTRWHSLRTYSFAYTIPFYLSARS